MTYNDIVKKVLIEYDKANITSSYPSLTTYEIATILDKAYFALINQKLTGNNPRRIEFEGDNKAIEDIQNLIKTAPIEKNADHVFVQNDAEYIIPKDFLYFVACRINLGIKINGDTTYGINVVKLVTHEIAEKFMCTSTNKPWVNPPVCYTEGDKLIVLVDPVLHEAGRIILTYVKAFKKFVDAVESDELATTTFDLSDSMAEELINLAIIFATEIVESPRLTTKTNIRPLES